MDPGLVPGFFVALGCDVRRLAVDSAIIEPWLVIAGNRRRDDPGRQITVGDAVTAVTVGGVNARMTGHAPDQRQTVGRRSERAGPHKLCDRLGMRPQPIESVQESISLSRPQTVSRLGFDRLIVVLAADDDPVVVCCACIAVVLRCLPDQRAVAPQAVGRLRRRRNGPAR